jgi:hypothetical protein
MNDPKATFVATCHPFHATASILKRRSLAREAKRRRDPGSRVIFENLVTDIQSAILGFEPAGDFHLAAWFGAADRLAYAHPSGALELLTGGDGSCSDDVGGIAFITVVGPRSYWPEAEARAYRQALTELSLDGESVEDVTHAAKALVTAARRREASWSRDEWQFRIMAAITGWIYWDDEPGAKRDV